MYNQKHAQYGNVTGIKGKTLSHMYPSNTAVNINTNFQKNHSLACYFMFQ